MIRWFRRRRPQPAALTHREAFARDLAYEAYQGSRLDMRDYDNNPLSRVHWLAEADRRLALGPDARVAGAWGLDLEQWAGLTDFERAECRRNVTTAPRFEVVA